MHDLRIVITARHKETSASQQGRICRSGENVYGAFTCCSACSGIAEHSCNFGGVLCGTTPGMPGGQCNSATARKLVGKPKPTDEDGKYQTGATIVRQIVPGQPVTQDYRDDRVTIEAEPASGRVVGATCG